MKAFIATSLLALVVQTAQAQVQDLNFQDYKRFLLQGAQTGSHTKTAITTTCRNSDGETFRIGDKGYDACLNEVKSLEESKKNNTPANGPATDSDTGASLSTTIEIGS